MMDNWWQTETGGPCLGTLATMTSKPGRVGKPLPGAELDIVDREGQPIEEPNKGGILVIKRPFPTSFAPSTATRTATLKIGIQSPAST